MREQIVVDRDELLVGAQVRDEVADLHRFAIAALIFPRRITFFHGS